VSAKGRVVDVTTMPGQMGTKNQKSPRRKEFIMSSKDISAQQNTKEKCNIVYEINQHSTRKWWWPINSNSLVTKACTVHKGHNYNCQCDTDGDDGGKSNSDYCGGNIFNAPKFKLLALAGSILLGAIGLLSVIFTYTYMFDVVSKMIQEPMLWITSMHHQPSMMIILGDALVLMLGSILSLFGFYASKTVVKSIGMSRDDKKQEHWSKIWTRISGAIITFMPAVLLIPFPGYSIHDFYEVSVSCPILVLGMMLIKFINDFDLYS
jgi:hypothetical protein